jgi:hypothetical protein
MFDLRFDLSKNRSMSASFFFSLCNVPSYHNVKSKQDMKKMDKKLKKKGQSLSYVTLKSRSRSTILMPALPITLRNIHVKFDKKSTKYPLRKWMDTEDPETSQTHIIDKSEARYL